MFKINMLYLCQFFYVSTRLIGIPAHQTRPTQIRNIQHNSTTLCRIKTEYRLQEVDLCHKIGENWLYRMLHICRLLTIFDKKLLFRCTPTHSIRFFFFLLSTFVSPSIQYYKYIHLFPPVLCFPMKTLLRRRSFWDRELNSVEEAFRGLKLNFEKENVKKSGIEMNRTFKTRQVQCNV